jgi:phosphatidylglycerophosphate synthase
VGLVRGFKQPLLKEYDAWTEVMLVDPLTTRIALWVTRVAPIGPLPITAAAAALKLCGAGWFFSGHMLVGAIFIVLGILGDGIDGKVARITGKQVRVHGTLDFLTDQVTLVIVLSGLVFSSRSDEYQVAVLLAWLCSAFVLMSLASTRYRLLASRGGINTDKPGELRLVYENAATGITQRIPLANFCLVTYARAFDKSIKYRVPPHPTVVDSEYILLVLTPVFLGLHWNQAAIVTGLIALVALIPDLLYQVAVAVVLTLEEQRSYHG